MTQSDERLVYARCNLQNDTQIAEDRYNNCIFKQLFNQNVYTKDNNFIEL